MTTCWNWLLFSLLESPSWEDTYSTTSSLLCSIFWREIKTFPRWYIYYLTHIRKRSWRLILSFILLLHPILLLYLWRSRSIRSGCAWRNWSSSWRRWWRYSGPSGEAPWRERPGTERRQSLLCWGELSTFVIGSYDMNRQWQCKCNAKVCFVYTKVPTLFVI